MKNYYWTLRRHLVFSLIIVVVTFLSEFIALRVIGVTLLSNLFDIFNQSRSSDSASIGIIGGSDGPTSIFVSGNIGLWMLIYPQIVLFMILVFLYFPMKAYVGKVINQTSN